MSNNEYTLELIQNIIDYSLIKLLINDKELLNRGLREETICHRVANYQEYCVKKILNLPLFVDVEFDKMGNDRKAILKIIINIYNNNAKLSIHENMYELSNKLYKITDYDETKIIIKSNSDENYIFTININHDDDIHEYGYIKINESYYFTIKESIDYTTIYICKLIIPDIIIHDRKDNNVLAVEAKISPRMEFDKQDQIKLQGYADCLNYQFGCLISYRKGSADNHYTIYKIFEKNNFDRGIEKSFRWNDKINFNPDRHMCFLKNKIYKQEIFK